MFMRTEINRTAISRNEGDRRVTLGKVLDRTPQAKDDLFSLDATAGNSGQIFILDVMANDAGGQSKSLWSIKDGISSGSSDLLTGDVADIAGSSTLGAHISITADGKVAYSYTPELRAKLVSLSADNSLTDTFAYAIRLGNGVLSWTTATVEITGVNDPPLLSGTLIHFADGGVNASYMILESDLLIGFSDPDGDAMSVADLEVTNGVLTGMQGGWIFTPDTDFTGIVELQYNVIDSHGGSVPVNQNFMIVDTSDTVAPQLVSSIPWNSGALKIDENIVLNFDESIVAGSGDIIISNGIDTRAIDINDTSQVAFTSGKKGGSIIIDPTDDLIVDTNYNIRITSGVILDAAGNAYQRFNDSDTFDFMAIASDPLLNWVNPWDEGILKADNNIELYFDEPVVAGSGAIIISNVSDTRTIDIQDTSQVTFDGDGGVNINLIDDLIPDTNYSIQITAGAVLDTDGHIYAGINDTETLNFITTVLEPLLLWSNPWDEGTLKADNNIELYFDEPVVAGSGAIIISNGSGTRTIDIQDANQVTFDGYGSVIIDPIDDLIPDTNYSIQITAGAALDMDGRAYAGISDTETFDFMTIGSDPLLSWSNSWDEEILKVDSHIELYFDEPVVAGSGTIIISNGSDTRTIDIQDANRVTFDGYGSVIIDPIDDLILGADYYVQISAGAVLDTNGHAYAGIGDLDTFNFTTIDSSPLLVFSSPADDAIDVWMGSDIFLYFDEMVKVGSGHITISNGNDIRLIDIQDSNQVTFDGYTGVFINPAIDLMPNTDYFIQMDSGIVTDMAGHPYAGILDTTTLNFTTTDSSGMTAIFQSPFELTLL
jgi:VCBS repeat-containing protein